MKTIGLCIFMLWQLLPAQPYKWDWAISTGTCPQYSGTYFNILDVYSAPLSICTDHQGRLYVLGAFPAYTGINDRSYTVGHTDTNRVTLFLSPNYTGNDGLYLYCIEANGKIAWAHSIAGDFNLAIDKPKLAVNPYSGKPYIILRSAEYIFIDYTPIATDRKNSGQVRMMLCFDASGQYNKAIFSPGYMDQMVFASSDLAVYRSSKLSPFYPWQDSVSTFLLDAKTDTVLGYKTGFLNERIMLYNPWKNVFVSSSLHEYDIKLKLTKQSSYTYSIYNHGEKDLQSMFADRQGNYYMNFKNRQSDPFDFFWLAKIDRQYKTVWYNNAGGEVGLDTFGNPWVFTAGGLFKTDKLPYRKVTADPKIPDITYFINRIDTATGEMSESRILPTNMSEQSFMSGQLIIDPKNGFWISGHMLNEVEFGPHLLHLSCASKAIPLQHYVAKASQGWQSTRKNLSSASQNLSNGVQVFPNPSEGIVYLKADADQVILSIKMYDLLGRLQTIECSDDFSRIDLSALLPGIYMLNISSLSQNRNIQIIKI